MKNKILALNGSPRPSGFTYPKFIENIRKIIGVKDEHEVVREALTLLNWATTEVKEGRIILSSNKDFKDIHKLSSMWLNK